MAYVPDYVRRQGIRIRDVRHLAGWSQAQLAKALGVKQPMIAALEAGRYCPTTKALYRIGQALGVETSFLLPNDNDEEET